MVFEFDTNNSLMTILESGNVGIGTAAPNRKLHLYHAANDSNFIQITNSTTGETGTL